MKALLVSFAILLAFMAIPCQAQSAKDIPAQRLALANRLEDTEPHEALRLALEVLPLARQGDSQTLAALLTTAAYCCSQTGDLTQAVAYGSEALDLCTRIGNLERAAKAHNILGIAFTFMGAYSRALEEGLEALRLRQELGLESAVLQSLNMIGVVYHRSGQYAKAIEFYQSILDRGGAQATTTRQILAKLNIGFAQYKLGRLEEAFRDLSEGLELSRRTGETRYLNYAYVNLGLVNTDLGNHSEALRYLRMALAGYRERDQKYGRTQVLNGLGRLDLLMGQYDAGIRQALEAAELANQIQARDEMKTSYELLSTLHERKGDLVSALKYYKLYSTTKDSIYTAQESERIAGLSMNIVTLKKDYEIESLKKERMISGLRLQKERYAFVLLTSVLGALGLLLMVLTVHAKRTRDSKRQLEAANARLLTLNAELQDNIREVKTLSGLLPICANCKNIRDDDGYWRQLEDYISKHTSAVFSHGICPHCAEELYPEAMEAYRAQQEQG